MKIGIDARCLEWERGGVSRYLVKLLEKWPLINDTHEFILYFQNFIPDDYFLEYSNYSCRVINGPQFLRKRRILTEQLLIPFEEKKDNLDIYFATWYSAPIILKAPRTVVAAWDISYSTHPSHYSLANRFSLGYFSRISCQNASGIVTCSDYDAEQICKNYFIPKDKILTVYLSADDRFTPDRNEKTIQAVKNKYSLPERFLLSLGVIHNRRNVDIIIKAFNCLKDDYPDFGLVIVGRNNTQPHLDIESQLSGLISEGRANYIRWIDDEDLPDIYKSAEFYICTSTVDGESIMLKEAMKVGTPVITSPLLEGSIGTGNGYIINNPESIEDTELTIRKALNNNLERKELIKLGIDWNKQYSWDKVAKETLEFITSV